MTINNPFIKKKRVRLISRIKRVGRGCVPSVIRISNYTYKLIYFWGNLRPYIYCILEIWLAYYTYPFISCYSYRFECICRGD